MPKSRKFRPQKDKRRFSFDLHCMKSYFGNIAGKVKAGNRGNGLPNAGPDGYAGRRTIEQGLDVKEDKNGRQKKPDRQEGNPRQQLEEEDCDCG